MWREYPAEIKTSSGIVIKRNWEKVTTILGRFDVDVERIIKQDLKTRSTMLEGTLQPGSFNVLDQPFEYYKLLGEEQFWLRVNKPFLDAAIERGDDIVLATKPTDRALNKALPNGEIGRTGFGREYDYLRSRGFDYDEVTGKMSRKH